MLLKSTRSNLQNTFFMLRATGRKHRFLIATAAFASTPARANSAPRLSVEQPQPASSVNTLAARIDAAAAAAGGAVAVEKTKGVVESARRYAALPLPIVQTPTVDSQLPIVAPSPRATIDYAAGKRRKTGG